MKQFSLALILASFALELVFVSAAGIYAQTPPALVNGVPQIGYIVWNEADGIYRYTFADKQTRKLIDKGRAPKIDPLDGTRIIYSQPVTDNTSQIKLMNPDGGNQRNVGPVFRSVFQIEWSPGRALTFSAGMHHPAGGAELWFMDTLGHATRVPATPIDTNVYGMTDFYAGPNNLALVMVNSQGTHLYTFDQSNPAKGLTWLSEVGPCGLSVSADFKYFTNFTDAIHDAVYIKTYANPPVTNKTFTFTVQDCEAPTWSNYDDYGVVTQSRQNIYFLDMDHMTDQYVLTVPEYEPYFSGGGSYPTTWVGDWAGRTSTFPLITYTATDDPAVFTVTMAAASTAKIYYRTDGSTPDNTSSLYSAPFNVTLTGDSMVIKGIACDAGLPASPIATVVVPKLQMLAPDNPTDTVHGLDYSYYELTLPQYLSAIDTATAKSTGTDTNFTIPAAGHRDSSYGYVFRGYISVPATGRYKFALASCDGSALYIGNTPVIITDGIHSSMSGDSGIVGLQAGLHQISVYYFLNGTFQYWEATAGLSLSYRLMSGATTMKVVPASVLYRVSSPSKFTITSPQPGQKYRLGDTVSISFTYAAGPSMPVIAAFSPDDGQSFVEIMQHSVLTDANGACVYKWAIPNDQQYVSSQAVLKVYDYVMPTIFALTGDFTIQNPTATKKLNTQKTATPQLRTSNGRMAVTNAEGYRVELYNCSGRRLNSVTNGGGASDLGRYTSGLVICRIIKNRDTSSPGDLSTTQVVPLQSGAQSVR